MIVTLLETTVVNEYLVGIEVKSINGSIDSRRREKDESE
jgi:hypothetical protein